MPRRARRVPCQRRAVTRSFPQPSEVREQEEDYRAQPFASFARGHRAGGRQHRPIGRGSTHPGGSHRAHARHDPGGPGRQQPLGLGASGEPAPDNVFYYGGPAIILTDGTLHDFDASEKVQVFLGTQVTGTQLITASAAANGTLRTSVPVPQVFPGSYLLTAYGVQSTHWYTVAVPIGPVAKPSVTQGTSGTNISLTGSGFQPNESVSVYTDYSDTQHLGIFQSSTTADSLGSFTWASAVVTGTTGQVKVAAVGAISHAVYFFYFTILPVVQVSPVMGTAGTVLTATGSGYGTKYPQVGLWFGSLTTRIGLTNTNGAGNFAMYTATVPSTGVSAKTYTVYAASYNRTAVAPYGLTWFTVVTPNVASMAIEGLGLTPGGSPGGPLTVGGLGWSPSGPVTFTWGILSTPTSTVLAQVTPLADGSFVASVPVPTAAQATWYLYAQQGATRVKVPYRISYAPHLSLASTVGAAGQAHVVTVASGGGFAPGETVSFTLKSPKNVALGVQAVTASASGDVAGQGIALPLASSAVTGTYTLAALGLSSKAAVSASYKVMTLARRSR